MGLNEYIENEFKEIIFYVFLLVFVTIILPIAVGFGGRAFEESFTSEGINISQYLGAYLVYYIFILASLTLIIFPLGKLLTIKKGEHPSTQKPVSWFRIFTCSFIFAPEENGFLYWVSEKLGFKGEKNLMRWSKSIIRVIVISIIIFGTLGILQTIYPQLAVSGIPQTQLPMQVTFISEVLFSVEPASFSENATLLFIFSIFMGINAYVCAKLGWGKGVWFAIGFIIICPLMGIFWMAFHNVVYSNSSASLFATFIFGWLGSTLTLLLGIFILWWIWHESNNAFSKISELVTLKEDVILISIVVLALLTISWISIEVLLWRYRKKNKVENNSFGV